MHFRVFEDPVWIRVGHVPVTQSMVTALVISLALFAAAIRFRAAVREHPDGLAAALAGLLVEAVDQTVEEIVGHPDPALATFAGSLFLFILSCNLAGHLPGLYPATGSLATTAALAAIVLFAVPAAGIRTLGLRGYLKHYFQPNPLMLPLHILSELSRTVALALRLFGNVMSGHLVVALLIALVGFLLPVPLMALDVLIGLLQAYIFAVLAAVYVGAATTVGGEG